MQPPAYHHLLFIGASVRWAAQSAVDAGYQVSAIDMFGDADLTAITKSWQQFAPGQSLTSAIAACPADAIVFVGAIEQFPQILSDAARLKPVLGATFSAVQQLRDPRFLDRIAFQSRLRRPARRADGVERSRNWLRKQLYSSGGLGVSRATAVLPRTSHRAPDSYLERHVVGRSFGVSYLATCDATHLVSIAGSLRSRQTPQPFMYLGSIGPVELEPTIQQQLLRLGENIVANSTGLIGLFGVDVIVDPQGEIWLLEVNPRPTASLEVVDVGASWMDLHVRACLGEEVNFQPPPTIQPCGKRVIYAPRDLIFRRADLSVPMADVQFADIPNDQQSILRNEPVCTCFASSTSLIGTARKLAETSARLRSRFTPIKSV